MEQREFIVEAEAAGQRIDRFLSGKGLVAPSSTPKASTRRPTKTRAVFYSW